MKKEKHEVHLRLEKTFGRWENSFGEFDIPGAGKWRLCPLTAGDMIEIGKIVSKPTAKATPEELADVTLRFILRKDKATTGAALTEDEVRLIPENLKETLFEKFVEGSPYLYRESVSETEDAPDGKRTIRIKNGEIIHPREPNESAIHYYHRLATLYAEKQTKHFQKMFKHLNFSTGLNNQILNSVRDLDALANPLKSMVERLGFGKIKSFATAIPIAHELPSLNLTMPARPEVTAIENLRDELRESNEKSLSVFANISTTLIGMLNELKGSTTVTNISLWIAIASLFVSVCIGGAQLYLQSTDKTAAELKEELHQSVELQKQLIEHLDKIAKPKGK